MKCLCGHKKSLQIRRIRKIHEIRLHRLLSHAGYVIVDGNWVKSHHLYTATVKFGDNYGIQLESFGFFYNAAWLDANETPLSEIIKKVDAIMSH